MLRCSLIISGVAGTRYKYAQLVEDPSQRHNRRYTYRTLTKQRTRVLIFSMQTCSFFILYFIEYRIFVSYSAVAGPRPFRANYCETIIAWQMSYWNHRYDGIYQYAFLYWVAIWFCGLNAREKTIFLRWSTLLLVQKRLENDVQIKY